ncbi:unnamed protein product [Cylicocyclus nassatus]|uniref:Uncharacterized protein n=1 Tax=Cylicocyclus nassatus TaxID=53992 RepID=A0AA36GDJ5_CYLNA|nr:unnamed protein product [Cylicocyclus nassatus]
MFVYLLLSTWSYRCQACVRTSPTLPPRSCPCPMNLYDVNLCPPVGICYRDVNAVTYTPGFLCTAMIHCPPEYYVRFLLKTGGHLDNLLVRDVVSSQYRIECRGNQWFLVHPRFPNGQAISRLICYDTPIFLNLRDISKTTRIPLACRLCSAIENTKENNLCPPNYKCSEPTIKTVTYSIDCSNSVLECPGSELVLQLRSGLSTIVYTEDVRCDGMWTYYDGHDTHQIESMLCLSE